MKFAHMADCHIGAWRDPKLKDLSMQAFIKAVDISIKRKVDFILISGDLFNTSMPPIEYLKETTKKLKELNEKDIPVYIIPGSHDQSPSGKTMLDVLEEAGLLINVFKGRVEQERLILDFTLDKKTGAKITGVLGKRGMLDRKFYEHLTKANLERAQGMKIFMFHTALTELKPKEMEKMDSNPLSFLPKGFEYYAGGHVHIVKNKTFESYKNVVFPGPLMPVNFAELEKLRRGSFYIYNHGKLEMIPIEMIKVYPVQIDANNRTPEEVYEMIEQFTKAKDFSDTIVLIRVSGKLKVGHPNDINFKEIFKNLYAQRAFFVMKSTSKLTSEEFEEIKISSSSVEEVENAIMKEHLGQIKTSFSDKEEEITRKLIKTLSEEKHEGEKVYEYEERMKKEIEKILEL
ncbi:exonuclease SbcCD subunit D [Candidatus Woesearchaeota archaeon]|nr:exonuclease SbcCD subunit D [Candidatus Woesearchaeota archaeon]